MAESKIWWKGRIAALHVQSAKLKQAAVLKYVYASCFYAHVAYNQAFCETNQELSKRIFWYKCCNIAYSTV